MNSADMGNWSLLQVFQEGGRLLRQDFLKFWPSILFFILPASLITVMDAQFHAILPPHINIQGCTDVAPKFICDHRLLWMLLSATPEIFILMSMVWMSVTMTNAIYSDEAVESTRHSETLNHSIDRAVGVTDVATENRAKRSLVKRAEGKKLRGFAAMVVLRLLYSLGAVTGGRFTQEAVAAMGLPPWVALVSTVPITVLVTVFTSYLLLVYLVLGTWLFSPSLELCKKKN